MMMVGGGGGGRGLAADAVIVLAAVVLVCVAELPVTVSGTQFYISPTGDDSNAGMSPSAAWRSLSRASKHKFTPGDVLSLERGGRWLNESLTISPVDHFVLQAYGNTSLPRPTLVYYRPSIKAQIDCVQLVDVTNVTVKDIHVTGCFAGLRFLYTSGRAHSNVEVANCHFRDMRHAYESYQPSDSHWAQAIALTGNGGHVTLANVTVHHTTATRIDSFFATSGLSVRGLWLDANTVAQCGGNCYGLSGGTDMHITNSVFLRDTPSTYFMYGTTDVIVGTISGDNSIVDSDFNTRGEYEAAPDGCAIDFETSAIGFAIRGNTIYRSWGGGIMVFGHATTSQGFDISNNTFVHAGCVQPRNDRAGIAFMCPGGHKPSGLVADNVFTTCQGVPAMYDAAPNCSSNVTKTRNSVDSYPVADQPQISFSPPAPTSKAPHVVVPALATTRTANATLRYTLDGSRPTEASPAVPKGGVRLTWPGPDLVMNVRAFHPQMRPSITNGVVVERSLYEPRGSERFGNLRGNLDALTLNAAGAWLRGWAVDSSLPGLGRDPVTVRVDVDMEPVAQVTANMSRPDLVPSGVAPNAAHGFNLELDASVAKTLRSGSHIVDVFIVDSPLTRLQPHRLPLSPICTCEGSTCPC